MNIERRRTKFTRTCDRVLTILNKRVRMSKFYKFVKNEAKESELILDGVIASESWYEDEVSPKTFREELSKHSGALTVRINSPGGDVFAGVAIYNYLREHDGEVTVKVDGLAASAASFIAMAGDKIVMLPGSMLMIHMPWSVAAGNAEEMSQVVDMLNKTGESMIPLYAARTGQSEEKIEEMLKAETWLTAKEAVDMGFADEAVEARTASLSESINAALKHAGTVQNAVMQPVMSLKSRKVEATDVSDAPEEPAEPVVEEQEAESKETTEVTEPVVDEVKQSEEKETVMTEQEKVAAAQVIEPAAQATVVAKPSAKDYLDSKEAMEDFARVLEANAGKTADVVRADWKKQLEVKAGVTNPEVFLPTPLITEIEDAFRAGGPIWNGVTKTGLDAFQAAWDSNTDPDAESGRAKGYNRDEEEEKAEQELTIAARILRPQMVYKYITLNREDVKEQRTTGALVRFVLAELPRRIIREIERAIVIGDGRAPGSAFKIQAGTPRGFYPVKADATANNAFASTYTPLPGESVYASLVKARDLLEAEGSVVLVAKKGFLTTMALEQNVNGGFLFAPGADLGSYVGVTSVVEPDWMSLDDDNDAYLVVLSNYRTVGDQSIEAFTNFILKTNKHEYLQEIYAGGGLTVRKSAVAIASVAS